MKTKTYNCRAAVVAIVMEALKGKEPDILAHLAASTDIPPARRELAAKELQQALPMLMGLPTLFMAANGRAPNYTEVNAMVGDGTEWKDDEAATATYKLRRMNEDGSDGGEIGTFTHKLR